MKIGVGADPNGLTYQNEIIDYLYNSGHDPIKYMCDTVCGEDYPDVAKKVGESVLNGTIDRGILICGTGIGMAISANKVPGIRAACCHDIYSAERAQLSNNAQIITIGQQVIGIKPALRIVEEFLSHTFKDGRSTMKIEKISKMEKAYLEKRARS
ncbi:RpiB/LacA/LacB family sugar-phosphate isomerase [Heyndrickxia acidiproducens]|uniref:RpiB/LacA/LacB family sugar-phosphate isomerase n=1 Tax=Heyndrickxia acidiproducens TaxID=1121084 RepID=UPI000376651A|nr:RpiB/LacA/LacB family sugar-phosphate isomerase [Heyndrickxia acidiproducens]